MVSQCNFLVYKYNSRDVVIYFRHITNHPTYRLNSFLSILANLNIPRFIALHSLIQCYLRKRVYFSFSSAYDRSYLGDIRLRISFSHSEPARVFGARRRKCRVPSGDSRRAFLHARFIARVLIRETNEGMSIECCRSGMNIVFRDLDPQ